MTEADLSAPRPAKAGAIVAVALLHVAAAVLLVRAFAPGFVSEAVKSVVSTFSVTITAPEPTPTPPPPAPDTSAAGKSGEAGKHATPREVLAPKPKVEIAHSQPAPRATSTGTADSSGARDAGAGTGAGGPGDGTGSGAGGNGTGAGGSKVEKIAGEINSARDYPIATRDLRIGGSVVIYLTVGTDGRASACRVARPSRDPQSDAITCRLAVDRFRFRPATDPNGKPLVSTYGWQQRWFYMDKP